MLGLMIFKKIFNQDTEKSRYLEMKKKVLNIKGGHKINLTCKNLSHFPVLKITIFENKYAFQEAQLILILKLTLIFISNDAQHI